MRLIVTLLFGPAAIGFINGKLHRLGYPISVHDNMPVYVSGGTANCLY